MICSSANPEDRLIRLLVDNTTPITSTLRVSGHGHLSHALAAGACPAKRRHIAMEIANLPSRAGKGDMSKVGTLAYGYKVR